MLRFFLFISLIYTFNSHAQNSVEFIILNEEQKAIPFTNVYCTSTKTGGYSDLNGKLTIKDVNKKDTLLINSYGYEEKLIIVSEISDTIILNIQTIDFEEFTIKSEYERKTYGVTRKTFFKSRSRGGYIGYREGIVMDIAEESRLENVELFIANKEDSSRTKFSLMVYSVTDSTDIPKESLLMEKVFFDDSTEGWSKVNLDSLGIFIKGKVFIGVETVPNFDFEDAPSYFSFTDKPHAQYKSISYFFNDKSLLWVHGYVGKDYTIGFDSNISGSREGATNNFPMIKATFKK